jgi:hypothetical protein
MNLLERFLFTARRRPAMVLDMIREELNRRVPPPPDMRTIRNRKIDVTAAMQPSPVGPAPTDHSASVSAAPPPDLAAALRAAREKRS